jgi:hypothetical protein
MGWILKALGEWMMGEALAVESTSEHQTARSAVLYGPRDDCTTRDDSP